MRNFICISSGHSLHVRGAAGSPVPPYLDEVDEARRVVDRVALILNSAGVTVKSYHDNISKTQNENLNRIVDWHNSQEAHDLDVSVHFNASKVTSNPVGTECWYKTQSELAGQVSLAIADASGLKNRGAKPSNSLFFLNSTSAPAILIEVAFVDSTADSDLYRRHFEQICSAIAATVAGKTIGAAPTPPPLEPPAEVAAISRPTISHGDYGYNVREVQEAMQITVDGDFGRMTESAIEGYQSRERLSVDGVVGPDTWKALDKDFQLSAYPAPLPAALSPTAVDEICDLASNHAIADYKWKDRGKAPIGYIKGMAVAYAQAYARLSNGDPLMREMAKAANGDADVDALAWYDEKFEGLGMDNDEGGVNTLRHLFVLLMGLGMRESSGQHCCGRDQSASNTNAETCEAGLFQTSWNIRNCCTDIVNLFDQYSVARDDDGEVPQGYLKVFAEGVTCDEDNWECYGTGDGFTFQQMSKQNPTFTVEVTAIGLRNMRQHWGPINRMEAEIVAAADDMLGEVQDYLALTV